jgi:outer membrane immunogenic protein
MKNSLRIILFVLVLGGARAASAQNPVPWDGFYVGVNAGEASPHSCHTVAPAGTAVDASAGAALTTNVCPGGADLAGGLQFGENFQYKRLVLGMGADIDLWNSKNQSQAVKYGAAAEAGGVQAAAAQTAAVPPSGTYTESGKLAPRAFAIIGPRIGYAGDTWLPYLRAGAILTAGTRTSTLYYTAPSAVNPTASFSSGKNFSSTGWVAGGGTEIGLNGAWSITLEFLHASLGKPTDFSASCAGTVTACTAFSGIAFDSVHDHFTANIFRVGVTYWFSYWNL